MVVALRQNTFKVDFRDFEKRPSYEDVHKFVFGTIGLRPNQVQRLQMNHIQCCVHVKCNDLETALRVVEQHNGCHELEVDGKQYKVRLAMNDDRIEVKVHDLSENVSNSEIATFLQQYGEVFNVKEAVWGKSFAGKGIPSGVRVVQMTLKEHLKSYITIKNEKTYVSYNSQPATCRHCAQLLHAGKSCAENKRSLQHTTSHPSVASDERTCDAPVIAVMPKKKSDDKPQQLQQKLQQQQHLKRTANQIDPSKEKSPPRKKKEKESSVATHGVNEMAEVSSSDEMETEEEPEYDEDPEKWIVWLQKKQKKKKCKSNC